MSADKIIEKYLNFGGDRNLKDCGEFLKEIGLAKQQVKIGSEDYLILEYVEKKIVHGFQLCIEHENIYAIIDEQSKEEIIEILKNAGYLSGFQRSTPKTRPTAKKKASTKKNSKKKSGLGKIVDHGNVAPRGNSDQYWRRQGIKVVFKPNDPKIRVGEKIPDTYLYSDVRFIENYYGLRAIEFGNWLSQQDRINYLSGLGIALFDLHKALKFTPKQISIAGKISVAFGARGRGKALAHFEPGSFAINLTRYSRPNKVSKRPKDFKRVELILKDGGVGAFAHEYGHALDYFGGLHVEKGDTFGLSRDEVIDPRPDPALMKKNTLRGLMEKLIFKICWKDAHNRSNYFARLVKATQRKYYFQRNEIFARAFEIYVQYKLAKYKYKNTFLNFPKYDTSFYLTLKEMQDIEKEFDALMKALKKHL